MALIDRPLGGIGKAQGLLIIGVLIKGGIHFRQRGLCAPLQADAQFAHIRRGIFRIDIQHPIQIFPCAGKIPVLQKEGGPPEERGHAGGPPPRARAGAQPPPASGPGAPFQCHSGKAAGPNGLRRWSDPH